MSWIHPQDYSYMLSVGDSLLCCQQEIDARPPLQAREAYAIRGTRNR
jgi:hypothetical protein